ncbi:hypothetical protein [Enterococcus faecalis]|uniref:hypothetical protein n=1 Tax=Enterococcus faecalis TaxID=1351 RepID=UPI00045A03C7|nr:hypothetical protein [Enterococcus faecalis]KAJ85627.1 LtrD protein [Enterococcus faecalis NY9]
MTVTNEDMQFVIAQILLIDPSSERPKIHPKRIAIKKGQLTKRLDILVQDYENANVSFDLTPYKETIKALRRMRAKEQYQQLIDEIVLCYTPSKKEQNRVEQKPLVEEKLKENIAPIVPKTEEKIEVDQPEQKEKINWLNAMKKKVWPVKFKV